jgi:hypothetical protein
MVISVVISPPTQRREEVALATVEAAVGSGREEVKEHLSHYVLECLMSIYVIH